MCDPDGASGASSEWPVKEMIRTDSDFFGRHSGEGRVATSRARVSSLRSGERVWVGMIFVGVLQGFMVGLKRLEVRHEAHH